MDNPLKPTYGWEGDKSLYDGSAGRTQLVGILNQDIQPHLSNTSTEKIMKISLLNSLSQKDKL